MKRRMGYRRCASGIDRGSRRNELGANVDQWHAEDVGKNCWHWRPDQIAWEGSWEKET